MTFADWTIDIVLVGLVVLQLRGRRLTLWGLLLPLALVGWAAVRYLHGIPTAGNDLVLVIGAAAAGLALGVGAGVLTRVYRKAGGAIFARASIAAAVLWVLGVGFRLAFQLYATNGGGAEIGKFSVTHQLTIQAWPTAIVLMALCEVVARTAVVWLRSQSVRVTAAAVPTAPVG